MSPFRCPFCAHDNPAGARFCNDCGSPLYLKPCPQCDAVNDAAAVQCHQCGTALEATLGTDAALTAATQAFARDSGTGARDLSRELHVPESFASRYGLVLDDANRPPPGGDPPADIDPREHEIAGLPSLMAGPREESFARPGRTSSGVLLVIALVVMAAVGYYGYRHWAAPVGDSDVAAPGVSSTRDEAEAQTKAVAPAPAPGATAPGESSPSAPGTAIAPAESSPSAPGTATAPAENSPSAPVTAAAPAESSPSAPVTATAPAERSPSAPVPAMAPVLEDRDTGAPTPPENVTNASGLTASPESPAGVSAAAPPADVVAPAARERSRPARLASSKGGATNRRANKPASETRRIIDRQAGKTGVARGTRPEGSNDPSSIETQRIIERELGTRAASPGAAAADANRR